MTRTRGHNDALDAEDAALWAHVAAEVRPLLHRHGVAKPTLDKSKTIKKATAPISIAPVVATKAKRELRPLAPTAREKLPRTDERRLKRGSVALGGRLDLHGMTRPEAHRAVGRFLTTLAERGERVALVITGKGGVRGPGGAVGEGVLRGEFPHWVSDGALARVVLAWRPAAPQHGGDGAFYVLLRRTAAR